ncbi:MAG TPA: BamA/TamA family outer membrane protein [Rubricoccaceae bacterium]
MIRPTASRVARRRPALWCGVASPALAVSCVAFAALAAAGCATTRDYVAPRYRDAPAQPLPEGVVAYRVFLTGNTGDVGRGSDAVLTALGADARAAGQASAVVLLGDETPGGLREGDAQALRPVQALGRAFEGYPGRIVALPGDRDWEEGKDGVERLEDALIQTLGDSVLTPGDQAGGPRVLELAPGLSLIALDTAWWLRDPDERPEGEFEGENVRSPADVATYLESVIEDRSDDRIVVVGHHPVVSNGEYAGQRTVGQTVATLGVGPLLGQTVGTSGQSLASERYRSMRTVLDGLFARQDRLVYASAHDRSLQTFDVIRSEINRQAYLVSGTGGGQAEAAVSGRGAAHILPRPGYQRLVYFADGRLWAETVEVDVRTGATTVAFRSQIAEANPELTEPEIPETTAGSLPPELGGRVIVPTDVNFVTGSFRNDEFTRTVWGEGYRDVWATPVSLPVLDLGTEAGGLTPLYITGSNQTTGLRFEGADGREYNLRLVEKGGTGQIPEELRNGVVGSVVLDLRSAQTPFGAVVAYPLSRAADVLISRPRLVYIPDDPRLGRYREQFAGRVGLIETRAADDMRGVEGFDGVADVVSESKLREELRGDQDRRVDQRAFLRARLIDMMVADWDRHEGQWRWAEYEPGDLDPSLSGDAATRGKVYRPIAQDHDFAFYAIGGLAPRLLERFADERLQPFGEDFGGLRGLTANGFEQDRRFFNELTLEDMQEVARAVQADLSDAAIDASVRSLPSEIYAQVGPEWTLGLRSRRDRLVEVVSELYELHSGIVDVVGSDERERFTATREADGQLSVVVRSDKDGNEDRILYERRFFPRQTREVRLYGFGGRDRFEVVGDGPDRIAVRVIGGGARDSLTAPAGDVAVYDTPQGLTIGARGRQVEDRRSDDGDINRYDSYESVLRRTSAFPLVGYNPTDGIVLGAQVATVVPGFRIRPQAATHTLGATVATSTGGLAARYTGRMREAVGVVDLDVDALASTPRYVRNFYGFGNNSAEIGDRRERVELARIQADAGFGGDLGQNLRLVAGPTVRYADVARGDSGTVTPVDVLALTETDVFSPQVHTGAFARVMLSTAYGGPNPVQGFRLMGTGAYRVGVTGAASNYGTLGGEAQAFFPINYAPQLTLAVRAGADHRFGDFPFFDAAVVGGDGSLRGYRRERFAGRTAAYAGAEVRAKLFRLDTYALPVTIGVLAFGDAGRVWSDEQTVNICGIISCGPVQVDPDDGSDLHFGYGGGLSFNALDRAILTLTVGRSSESTLVTFGTGFSF